MSMTIYKYELMGFMCSVEMPVNSQILDAQRQDGKYMVWALVDTTMPLESRGFIIHGTGHTIRDIENLEYLKTIQDSNMVWHLFVSKKRIKK